MSHLSQLVDLAFLFHLQYRELRSDNQVQRYIKNTEVNTPKIAHFGDFDSTGCQMQTTKPIETKFVGCS